MPLYEYQCSKCGGFVEALQRLSDPPLTVHVGCGGALHKLVSPSAFHFKGSGWYVTDYAKGAQNKSVLPKPEAKDVSKTEAPKAAAESKPSPAKT